MCSLGVGNVFGSILTGGKRLRAKRHRLATIGRDGAGWAGQVRELLDFLTWISSFEGFTLRPTIASYS